MRQFFEISKVDAEQRMVYGYASTAALDSQGETVTLDAMKGAWDDYMKFANVREMHGSSAVGVVKEHSFDDKGVFVGVKVVDDAAWEKVVEKVYKGFSIGGQKLKDGYDKVTKTITGLKLTEISLVDRPANPEALIEVFKADGFVAGQDPDLEPVAEVAVVKDGVHPTEPGVLAPIVVDTTAVLKSLLATAEGRAQIAAELEKANAPVVIPEKSDLRKSIAALALTDADAIKKGLYDVGTLADLICSLSWLQSCATYEATYENDGSSLPAQLAALVQQAGNVLLAMVQEEVGELVAGMKLPDGMPAVTMLTEVIAMSAYGTDLKKYTEALDVVKAGARNSATDKERIQKAHDLIAELGADCATEKHDHTHDLNKSADFEKMAGEMGTLRKSFDDLTGAHALLKTTYDTLKKTFDAAPAPTKGQLRVVEKGTDSESTITDAAPVDSIAPVLKQDGSVDDVATAMKKVHAGGGRPFGRQP